MIIRMLQWAWDMVTDHSRRAQGLGNIYERAFKPKHVELSEHSTNKEIWVDGRDRSPEKDSILSLYEVRHKAENDEDYAIVNFFAYGLVDLESKILSTGMPMQNPSHKFEVYVVDEPTLKVKSKKPIKVFTSFNEHLKKMKSNYPDIFSHPPTLANPMILHIGPDDEKNP